MSTEAWNPLARLTEAQRGQLEAYAGLLRQFNRGINLISREDEADIASHHLLHCLTLTRKPFPAGASVVDWGTGGGLPAIPLAIAFPRVTFHAVDAVEKKVQAVRAMARRLGLTNLHPWHGRAESWPGQAVFSVSRATAPLLQLWQWHAASRVAAPETGDTWHPGLVCLKGGDLSEEIGELHRTYPHIKVEAYSLFSLLRHPYFQEKYILEVHEDEPPPA